MVEGKLREWNVPGGESGDQIADAHGAGERGQVRESGLGNVGHDHDFFQARQARRDLPHLAQRIVDPAVVVVAVGDEQQLGCHLAEAVDHALHAEVGRGRGPDRANAGRREHGDHRFRNIGQVAGDAVTGLHAKASQGLRQPRHLRIQIRMAHAAFDPVLTPEQDRRRIVAPAQKVLGKVEPRVREPPCPGHSVAADQHFRSLATGAHPRKSPQRRPELLRVLD